MEYMTIEQIPERSRCRCIAFAAIVAVILVVMALGLGLFYGLKSDDTTTPMNDTLKVVSVRSEGLVGDTVKVTVTYHASPYHTVYWRFMQLYGNQLRYAGKRARVMENGLLVHKCSKDIPITTTKDIYISISSGKECINMRLNATTLQNVWTYDIPEWKNQFVDIHPSVVAPKSGNITMFISLKVDMSVQYSSGTDFIFTGLNTTTNPPTVFEEFTSDADFVSPRSSELLDKLDPFYSYIIRNTTANGVAVIEEFEAVENIIVSPVQASFSDTTKLKISLNHDIVKYGGMFTIQLPERTDPIFVEAIKHGVWIDILQTGSNAIIPDDVVGFYNFGETVPFFGDTVTVPCFAMGNPSPDVEIIRYFPANSQLVVSENVLKDKWSYMEVVTLHDKKNQIGKYACRAVSGTISSMLFIEVYAAEVTQFVDSETGVIETTASHTVVRCSATGTPTPKLTFRQDYEYGPDIIASSRYKFARNETDGHASLTMTISPVNSYLHIVYCIAAPQTKHQLHSSTRIVVSSP